MLGLSVQQLRGAKHKDDPPELDTLLRLPADDARAALRSLVALQRRMRLTPLPFLPKSGYALWSAETSERGLCDARMQWVGGDYAHAESDASTQLALRGRDPFVDNDLASRATFVAACDAIFGALTQGTPFDMHAVLA